MNKNFEIKAKIESFEQVRKKLKNLKHEKFDQVDVFINSEEGRLKFRRNSNKNAQLIFYQRNENCIPMESNFKIFTYPDNAKSRVALKNFKKNYGIQGIVKKTRDYFRDGDVRIHLDDVQGLGKFIEIEVVASGSSRRNASVKAQEYLYKVLEIPQSNVIQSSYIDLIKR